MTYTAPRKIGLQEVVRSTNHADCRNASTSDGHVSKSSQYGKIESAFSDAVDLKMSSTVREKESLPDVQLAAGGIVWRKIAGVAKLAVIHRPKYNDWTLPKGKPEAGETLAQTALREIREEIGCDARFLDFVGVTHYALPDGRVKVVLFWNMLPARDFVFEPNSEVDELLWLTPKEAAQKLSHNSERVLLGDCVPPIGA